MGTTFDASRFAGAGSGDTACDDDATRPDATTRFDAAGDLKRPPGTDYAALIQTAGDGWRSWAGTSMNETDSRGPINSASARMAIASGYHRRA